MPLLKPQEKIEYGEFKCKLPVDLITDIAAYAKAIDSDVNYVMEQAIKRLTTDKDFQTWKEKNPDRLAKPATESTKNKRGPKAKQSNQLKAVSAA